ncbi:unnamed protein product [Hermetia illucens]|uniref:Uncharacterized protein n=2 Tax=Hermetia illucens TaxID=343691 RepID=A0A7R8UR97_HERIL|nr:unnamed protein product [Hermetia illucens]
MRKDILCIVIAIIFSGAHISPTDGVNTIMNDLLTLSDDTVQIALNAMKIGFNRTTELMDSCISTMMNSEMNQTTVDIQDEKLKAAAAGLTDRFKSLMPDLLKHVELAKARIASLYVNAESCETSLRKVCVDLKGKLGQCSSRRINAAISQIHNCVNDGVDHASGDMMNNNRNLNDMMTEFRDLCKKRRSCFTDVGAPRCLNEVMRNNLTPFFTNAQKCFLTIAEARPTMEPINVCTAEITADVPLMC